MKTKIKIAIGIIGIIFLLVLFIYIREDNKFEPFVDLRGGEFCGHSASGFGTCGYMGLIKDCDCDGEKYEWHTMVTDVGYEIRCDGKASNFRDIQLPWDICEYDPESRCRLLGEEACKEPALNKSILESLPKKGDDNAKITIIEFGDFTTEYSFKFFNETLLRLENEFINKGAVQFFWVGLPYEDTYNPGDKRAIEVAEAAKCAQEQGKFWEMHDKLFINQQNLTFENYNFENYQKWAQEIGLNEKEFNLCLDDRKYKKAVELEKSIAESMSLGTPTFYVNYKQLIGFQTFEEFEKEINKQLEDYY